MVKLKKTRNLLNKIIRTQFRQYLIVTVVISLVVLLCRPLATDNGYHLVSFILLLIVSLLATILKVGPILLASTLSSLLWNFFFIPPHFTFHIAKTEDNLLFVLFFIIALLNGVLTSRIIRQEVIAREREERTNALFQLTRQLSRSTGINEIIPVSMNEIRQYFKTDPGFILPDILNADGEKVSLCTDENLDKNDQKIAEWCFVNKKVAGRFTDNFSESELTFYPLKGSRQIVGVIYVKQPEMPETDKGIEWSTYLTIISNALEREFLGEMAQKAKYLDASDKLYKTLFNSISHELRIPIATILGSTDTLLTLNPVGNIQTSLYGEISMATLRLNRLIENLLNMSRLESGSLTIRLDWCDTNDLINKVTDELKDDLKLFTLKINIQHNLPLIRIDFGLMEQVLFNILYNSTQYAPAASVVEIMVSHNGTGELFIEVNDEGPGFKEDILQKLSGHYLRISSSRTGGLGLGLSIAKGFVEAHGGTVVFRNNHKGGASVGIRIPSERPVINE